jgi:ribosomal protection tetracycline resistance protein
MRSLNLGILAHVDAGKTSLTERLLYAAGVIDEIGSVDGGTTQTDSLTLERQRGITIKSAVASFVVDDATVNLIDTPGHPDFIAEVERVLSVLDGAVLVVSAVEGVQAQTRVLMRALQRLRIPTLIFVNKIDRQGADCERVLEAMAGRLTPAIISMGKPLGLGTRSPAFTSFGAADAVERIGTARNPFLATVGLRIEPAAIGTGVEFQLAVELGSMPRAFFTAGEDSVRDMLNQGIHGWQVTDCMVTMT